jgi:hypothetical protein
VEKYLPGSIDTRMADERVGRYRDEILRVP